MSRQMKVLFLPPPAHRTEPWQQAVKDEIMPKHILKICDYSMPLRPQLQKIDVVIDSGGSMGTREMADLSSSVKLWQILGTGYDHFDLGYWQEKGIPVANCPGQFSGDALADCAITFILMHARRWNEAQSHLQQGIFYSSAGSDLESKILGLIGFGASGRALARRARCFGMRIWAIDVRYISNQEQEEYGVEFAGKPEDLDQLMIQSDFVSLHLPLSVETRHFIDAEKLSLMKPSAFLINVARGALVDEKALYKSLAEGRIAGAGLDVFEVEPIHPPHPLLSLSNVLATPHVAGTTIGTAKKRARCAADNVDRIAAGLEPLYRLDCQGHAHPSEGVVRTL